MLKMVMVQVCSVPNGVPRVTTPYPERQSMQTIVGND